MSDSTMGTPPPPPAPRPAGVDALAVTLKVGDRAIGARVNVRGGDLAPDAPVQVCARRDGDGWIVDGPDGPARLGPRDTVVVSQGGVAVRVTPVRQARFSRFGLDQVDIVLPLLMLATMVLVLQISLLVPLFASEAGGDAGVEPSPEFIARLLEGQYDGKEQGVVAQRTARPKTGEAIENFYLQPGHDGPRDKIGGGKNVGDAVRDGNARGVESRRRAAEAAPAEAGGERPADVAPAGAESEDRAADPVEGEDDDGQPIAVHVDEGWGFTDWYDTQDARQDAEEIARELERARDVLRIDPDNPYGLATRAYYEYLALDFEAATRTYERFTTLYPEDTAGWNNLALVYKRKGEYQREEELYRIALSLDPNEDDAINNLAVCLAHQGRFDEALAEMKKLEVLTPDDAYADLHRAKIYAAMGKEDRAYRFLQKSLAGMRKLDTLHNIEFRQDIRLDPAFATMREQERFRALLDRYYGDHPKGWWNQKKKEQ